MKKDILGKEIKTFYANNSSKEVIENLQKQLNALYLYMEKLGVIEQEDFRDFGDSQDLAERIQKMNSYNENQDLQSACRSNYFGVIEREEKEEVYVDNNRSNPYCGSLGQTQLYIKNFETEEIYDPSDLTDLRRLVGAVNKMLQCHNNSHSHSNVSYGGTYGANCSPGNVSLQKVKKSLFNHKKRLQYLKTINPSRKKR